MSDTDQNPAGQNEQRRDESRIREAIAKANKAWNNQQQPPDTPGGTTVPVAAAGALPDVAAITINLAQGTWRTLAVLSQNSVLTLGIVGAVPGDQIQITKTALDEFTLTINNNAGAALLVMRPGVRCDATFQLVGADWVLRRQDEDSPVHAGTATLVAGTVTVAAPWITATTRISVMPNVPTTPGAGNATIGYGEVIASRVVGTSFTLNAFLAAGTINAPDLSTLQWIAVDLGT